MCITVQENTTTMELAEQDQVVRRREVVRFVIACGLISLVPWNS